MNNQVVSKYNEYLKLTGGDKASAASLALADVMFDERELPVPESLTIAEAAKRLHVSSRKVYGLCVRGEIIHHRVGRAIRLHPADIDEYQRRATKEARPRIGRFKHLRL